MVNPKNKLIDNRKPSLRLVDNRNPKVKQINFQNFTYLENRSSPKGSLMLLVPLITYPVAQTWNNAVRV